jgi:hypothetical protein
MKSKVCSRCSPSPWPAPLLPQVKPEDAIKFRQSGYGFMAWNMARIKMNVEGTYNKDEVIKAANGIQAIANSGMGALYLPGTDKGTGWEKTRAKPEVFTDKEKRGQGCNGFQQGSQRNGQGGRGW